MVKISRLIYISFILFCIITELIATPFQNTYNFFSNPLVLFYNPSLSVEQKGIPILANIRFLPDDNSFDIKSCLTIPFSNNSFSLGFNRDENLNNKFMTSYSLKHDFFYFGTVFTLKVDTLKSLLFSLDGSISLKFLKNMFISLNVRNLSFMGNDSPTMIPNFSISSSGGIPLLSDNFGYELSYDGNYYKQGKKKIGSGAHLFLIGKIISYPLVQYSIGFDFYEDELYKIHKVPQGEIGTVLKISESEVGVFFGYQHDILTNKNSIFSNVYFNPTVYKNTAKPSVSLKWSCVENGNGIYIAVKLKNILENENIKNWVLVLSSLPSKDGTLFRSFSGGNNPPATIYWDLKDAAGEIHDEDDVYMRIIVSDKDNNIITSNWEGVNSCKR